MGNIIKRDFICFLRDRGSLFLVVVFPSLLVFLLGNFLQHMDSSDTNIEPFTIMMAIETTDSWAIEAIQVLTTALEENASIDIVFSEDLQQAKQQVDTRQAASAVLFTDPLGMEIYEGVNQVQNRAVNSIFHGFARQTASLRVLAQYAPERLEDVSDAAAREMVQDKEFGYNRTMLDYYAVVMVVMISFIGSSIGGASALYESRRDGTLCRMLASPRSRTNIYIQSALGFVPQNILQVGCVMICSVLLFGAHYADTLGGNLLLFGTLFLSGICIRSLFMLVGLFIRVNPTFVLMPFLWIILFLSGTYSKEIYIEGVTNYLPAWLIQNAAFDLTVFGRGEKCLQVMLISVVLTALSTLVGGLLFRRKGVVIK